MKDDIEGFMLHCLSMEEKAVYYPYCTVLVLQKVKPAEGMILMLIHHVAYYSKQLPLFDYLV